MTFDEFVGRPQAIDNLIQHRLLQVERLQARCDRVTVTFSEVRVQTSRENTRETALIKLIDAKNSLNALMEEYDEAVTDVQTWLYGNLDAQAASLLEYRYIDNLRNEEIAQQMHYSPHTIKNKISKAVQEARNTYEQKGA